MGLLGRQPGIALFTLVEVAGLAVWLALARGSAPFDPATRLGIAVPAGVLGLGVLFVALEVEHLLTDATVNGLSLRIPVVAPLVFSATETALWALWLAVAEVLGGLVGVAVAGVVLAVLLVPQHTVEDNALRGEGLRSDLVDVGTLGFSIVEALAASVWLALVLDGSLLVRFGVALPPGLDPALLGLGVLAVLLFVEHNLGVGFARRTPTPRHRRATEDRPAET